MGKSTYPQSLLWPHFWQKFVVASFLAELCCGLISGRRPLDFLVAVWGAREGPECPAWTLHVPFSVLFPSSHSIQHLFRSLVSLRKGLSSNPGSLELLILLPFPSKCRDCLLILLFCFNRDASNSSGERYKVVGVASEDPGLVHQHLLHK